jgi:hypothetical protein
MHDPLWSDPFSAAVGVVCATLWSGARFLATRSPAHADAWRALYRFCGWLVVLVAGVVALFLGVGLAHALQASVAGLGGTWLLSEIGEPVLRRLRPSDGRAETERD